MDGITIKGRGYSNKTEIEEKVLGIEKLLKKTRIKGRVSLDDEGPWAERGVTLFFENVSESQIEAVETIIRQSLEGMTNAWLTTSLKRGAEKNYLPCVLNSRFVEALGLDLQSSGIEVENENTSVRIWFELDGKTQLYVSASSKLGESGIIEQREKAKDILDKIYLLENRKRKTKVQEINLPSLLSKKDINWVNVVGASDGGATGFRVRGNDSYSVSTAEGSIKMMRATLKNILQRNFLSIIGDANRIVFVKRDNKEILNYRLGIACGEPEYFFTPWGASLTFEKRLPAGVNYGNADKIVAENLNAVYYLLSQGLSPELDLKEYLKKTNQKCVCGEKFIDDPTKLIAELGCQIGAEERHILHQECWDNWKKSRRAKKYSFYESYCPFCEKDCYSHSTPWNGRRLVWPN